MTGEVAGHSSQLHDVAVVGAGIAGCAAARELANAGYDVVLLDRSDFGAATSSRSSRNLYCGLAYLKPDYPLWQIPFRPFDMLRRIRMCWTTMHCRAEMVRDMPERLMLLPYYFPYRNKQPVPSWIIHLGFRLISLFEDGVPLAYRRMPVAEAATKSPLVGGMRPGLSSVGYLEEYQYRWAERICVDTALEAERCGATVRTYTKVTGITPGDDGWTLTTSAMPPRNSGTETIRAKAIINATGPWIDSLLAGSNSPQHHVAKLKGVNLLVKLPDSYRGQGLQTFSSHAEGLGLYLMPWGEYHFIGPTESHVSDDPDAARVTTEEIRYLLAETNAIFPDLNLTPKDVIHGWCGVRPWSTDDGGKPTAPVRVREHAGWTNIFSLTGVTIMVNRHGGRLARRAIEARLRPSKTPLPPGAKRQHGRSFEDEAINAAQIADIINREHVFTLEDLMRRRLPFGWEADLGLSKLDAVSRIAAQHLGWDEERRPRECNDYRARCAELFLLNGAAVVPISPP